MPGEEEEEKPPAPAAAAQPRSTAQGAVSRWQRAQSQRRPGLAFAPPPPPLPPRFNAMTSSKNEVTATATMPLPQPQQHPPSFPASLAELVSSADAARSATSTAAATAFPPPLSSSWAHDFSPTTSADLVVHPKKVAAVREWLEAQKRASSCFSKKQQPPPPPPLLPLPRLLIVSGPPGCGKSTTVRVLASELGFDVLEWVAPLPTLWEEHAHLNSSGSFAPALAPGGSGGNAARSSSSSASSFSSAPAFAAPYQSKLDAFEAFVTGCRLAPLELLRSAGGGSGTTGAATAANALAPSPVTPRPRLTLVRDLPHASGADARRRLASALVALCRGSRGPAVLITTDAGGRAGASGGVGGGSISSSSLAGCDAAMGLDGGLHRELADAAAAAGAVSIAFNPATAAATARALLRAAEKAGGSPLGSARAAALAGAAGGDLRTALLGAQLAVAGEQQQQQQQQQKQQQKKRNAPRAAAVAAAARAPEGGANNRKRSRAAAAAENKTKKNDEPALPAGAVEAAAALASRDAGIGAMHALGKILHNKRDWEGFHQLHQLQGSNGVSISSFDANRRPLLESDPEEAVASAGLDASSSAAFLFENLPLFVQGEEALGDAASAAAYLAQSDVIGCSCSFARGGGNGGGIGSGEGSNFAEAAAATVAARGVAFSRARPAPRGWISLRGPLAGVAARAAASNAERLRGGGGEEATASGASTAAAAPLPLAALASSSREAAATLLPALRSLAAKDPRRYGAMLPEAWERLWQGKVVVERPRQNATGRGGSAVAAAAALAAEESGRTNGHPGAADAADEIENDDDDF